MRAIWGLTMRLMLGILASHPGRFLEALEMMGADITLENQREVAGEPVADIRVRYGPLKACRIAGDIIPRLIDEIPVLAVADCFAAVDSFTDHWIAMSLAIAALRSAGTTTNPSGRSRIDRLPEFCGNLGADDRWKWLNT
jgi:5-enolpyruvylshikimate-3-phosphate synthase